MGKKRANVVFLSIEELGRRVKAAMDAATARFPGFKISGYPWPSLEDQQRMTDEQAERLQRSWYAGVKNAISDYEEGDLDIEGLNARLLDAIKGIENMQWSFVRRGIDKGFFPTKVAMICEREGCDLDQDLDARWCKRYTEYCQATRLQSGASLDQISLLHRGMWDLVDEIVTEQMSRDKNRADRQRKEQEELRKLREQTELQERERARLAKLEAKEKKRRTEAAKLSALLDGAAPVSDQDREQDQTA